MATDFIIRENEGADHLLTLPWVTVWNPSIAAGDFKLADPDDEPFNIGGFATTDQLGSSIIHQLFSNRRRPDGMAGADAGTNPEGWHGDAFDIQPELGERDLGSLLYTLERAPANRDTAAKVREYALEALQTFVDQGRASHFMVTVELDELHGRLSFMVMGFAITGKNIFQNLFPFIG